LAIAGLGMPLVVLQEGGYAVDALGANAVAFLGALRGTTGGPTAS
jgi:acetoin utilization deacetylase AcuC-like enzyme